MDRERVAEECLRIEKHHGNVLAYLKGIGCVSPWGTWFRIQKEQLGRKACQITNGKGVDTLGKAKLTLADKKEAVRIAIEGGNPYSFLRSRGVGFPESTWSKIKKNITDPEILEKIPKKLPASAAKDKPSVPEIPEAAPVKAETPEMPVQLNPLYVAALEKEPVPFVPDEEDPEMYDPFEDSESAVETAVNVPLMYMDRKVTAIEDPEFGEFHRKGDWVDWKTKDGNVISFTITEWKTFHHMIVDDFRILGVEL